LLGESEAKRLLGQTLEEEKAADEKLNGIARTSIPALR
jgi:ferritin-like metal-binding protein YciE